MNTNKETIQMAVRELELAGATGVEVTVAKHVKVRFLHLGRRKMLVMPNTTSDWRANHNVRRDIRRVLSERKGEPDADARR